MTTRPSRVVVLPLASTRTILAAEQLEDRTVLTNYRWTGAGTDGNWGNSANWTVPTPEAGVQYTFPDGERDTAIFDGTSIKNASLDLVIVGRLQVDAAYTGTITIGNALAVNWSSLIKGGNFQGGRLRLFGLDDSGNKISGGSYSSLGLELGTGLGAETTSVISGTINLSNSDLTVGTDDVLEWKSGSINMTGSGNVYNDGYMKCFSSDTLGGNNTSALRLINRSGGSLLVWASPTVSGGFENRNSLTVYSGANLKIDGSATQTAGLTELRDGNMSFVGANAGGGYNVNTGSLIGQGTIDGNLVLSTTTGGQVTLSPGYAGSKFGTLTITKSMSMKSASVTTAIDVGDGTGGGNDTVDVTGGWAELNGTLRLTISHDWHPTVNTKVSFLKSQDLRGTDFSNVGLNSTSPPSDWWGSWANPSPGQSIIWKLRRNNPQDGWYSLVAEHPDSGSGGGGGGGGGGSGGSGGS